MQHKAGCRLQDTGMAMLGKAQVPCPPIQSGLLLHLHVMLS